MRNDCYWDWWIWFVILHTLTQTIGREQQCCPDVHAIVVLVWSCMTHSFRHSFASSTAGTKRTTQSPGIKWSPLISTRYDTCAGPCKPGIWPTKSTFLWFSSNPNQTHLNMLINVLRMGKTRWYTASSTGHAHINTAHFFHTVQQQLLFLDYCMGYV